MCVTATTVHQFIGVIAKFFLRVSPEKMFSSVINLHRKNLCGEPLCTLFHSCTPEAVVVNPRVHRVPWLKRLHSLKTAVRLTYEFLTLIATLAFSYHNLHNKPNLHYTRDITSKRVTSAWAHLHGVALGKGFSNYGTVCHTIP